MIDPDATPNIIRGDFLKTYNTILPAGEKFNIIIGNPPYNNSFNTGDNKPYLCFTFLSLHILNTNGYLLFISPPAIYDYLFLKKVFTQKCGGEIITYDKMLNIITINNDNEYLKGFFKGVGSVFTYYLIQNAPYKGKTNIFPPNAKNDNFDWCEEQFYHPIGREEFPGGDVYLKIREDLLKQIDAIKKEHTHV